MWKRPACGPSTVIGSSRSREGTGPRGTPWPPRNVWQSLFGWRRGTERPRSLTYTTFRVGRLTCHALEGGRQHLDGGAMFGVVPKALWSRRAPPDDQNRIPLALRCLLIEH